MYLGDSHEMYDHWVRVSCDVGYEYRAMFVSMFVSVGAAMSSSYTLAWLSLLLCIVDLLLVNSALFHIWSSLSRRSGGGSLYLFCQPCGGVSCLGPSNLSPTKPVTFWLF